MKVIPTGKGQTVTLMCSTSCPLTENPPAYIWYKNREFLYQDWSPWYQELVPSEEAVTYSCAIKGYEDLRAPEVSVGESQLINDEMLFKYVLKLYCRFNCLKGLPSSCPSRSYEFQEHLKGISS